MSPRSSGVGRVTILDAERFGAISLSHLPWALRLDGAEVPRTREADLGGSRVVRCRIGAMTGRRSPSEIRQTSGEFVALLIVHRGEETLTQGGRSATVRPGTAALWDGVRPVECGTPRELVKHTLFMPRELMRDLVPNVETSVARQVPASTSLRLLTSWLQSSMRETDLDAVGTRAAERVTIDLVRSALGALHDGPRDTRTVRLLQVKDFIERHLADPDLDLPTVARGNAMSVRYLHLLFDPTGETAGQFLRRRRLDRAHELLLAPGAPVSVTEVAVRTGFDSPSTFSRAYRNRFGVSPREARRREA
jgi:AraC family transcriptional activator of tynA and feaB